MMIERFKFQRCQRLSRQRDFERVFARRCTAADRLMVIYVDRNDLGWSRLGIKVGRRLGGAVIRNRVKRVIREGFRLLQHDLPAGLDVICLPRDAAIGQAGAPQAGEALQRLIRLAAKRLDRGSTQRSADG